MPYIKKQLRKEYDKVLKDIDSIYIANAGELNYLITNICLIYLIEQGINYENLNTVEGVLSKVKNEINVRISDHYEKKKRNENGDLDLFKKIDNILEGK